VVFSPDNVLVIASDTVEAGQPQVHHVSFRQEATQLDFVSRTGGRSIRGSADVDCMTGKVKAQSIALYQGSDLSGDQITSQGPDLDWRAPVAGTASALVMGEVCMQRTPPRVASNVPPPLARPAPAPAAAPAPAVLPVPAAPPRQPAPAPTLAAASPPPPPAKPPAPPAAPAVAVNDGGITVAQIGAFSSRQLAEGAWSRLASTFPTFLSGKTARIEPVTVNGEQLYRTSIQGFSSEAQARATCAELMARSQACFVRKTP
jgi:cell division protein FtsN